MTTGVAILYKCFEHPGTQGYRLVISFRGLAIVKDVRS